MAAVVYMMYLNRRNLRRNRVFRDHQHPLEIFDDAKVYRKFRFTRQQIFQLTDTVRDSIEYLADRKGSLTPVLQVLLTLRFYATGAFQTTIGDLIGVHQSTVSRTITRVTDAFLQHAPEAIRMPDQREANVNKVKFFNMQGLPNVFACIDGTQIRIQAPSEREHEYVNRKNYHSVNVQVVCDADLLFVNVVARWPGSVHDARILRMSPLFAAFEGNNPPVNGIILGDSGYMIRPWLLTPLRATPTRAERRYNFVHSSTRSTVERAIGVAKQRWHCLRSELRVSPEKSWKIIVVCFMLHNVARRKRLPQPPPDSSDEDSSSSSEDEDSADSYEDDSDNDGHPQAHTERARTEAGKAVRARIINRCF